MVHALLRTFSTVAATLWNSLIVRDRCNKVRGSPSLERKCRAITVITLCFGKE